ncbi:Y-family DNA polymerase [Bacteroides thetaiotaomicron]|uniref:Y-family DNA polymerase n=1 Tax=Bacteroides thetaiotaomicron TaxID=818 RepID=UPI001C38F4FC|nr:Y-family DNA polymerase [Bacteroides thetaiotaomicron]MBV4308796.1 Y-family DNA polymerase [Bacteroides thetaiotaomicron]MBV4330524.1 Y-family DNA polymerase [Bacteroides thetaiotaomicron]MCB7384474.1 Y-family DNA polymerase [Bacteroides thetaiotaomicron]MCG4884559.1 Y-family DNA polymerase [Bacteroides thetaiotaomicron]MCQ5247677.1 Y-family DNA polymerase [Bacteroides thetaiotaomicron]
MFGLIDCNNFYASCERVFNPALNGKPVIVLSNNDGCVIARSNEAKELGIKMGVPAYQIKNLIDSHGIAVFSSNYTLYGDMSGRVMSILTELAPEIEVYSIDEAFLNLDGIKELQPLGTNIVNSVTRGTGIPMSLGIASTKTLAKIANKFAKKYPAYNRVCIIDTEEKHLKALQQTEIRDVWGIGHKQAAKLEKQGVKTAYDFIQLPEAWVRKEMTVTGERTWKELRGISCIRMESIPPAKKQICTSRSFGKMISDIDTLIEAIATHASTCARKLRKQKAYAHSLMVFIHTNNFREDLPQYWKNTVVHLPVPSNDTQEIIHYALIGLKNIFMQGYQYKKAGVIITEITENAQLGLFDSVDREKHHKLMQIIDKINGDHGQRIKLAVQGNGREWKLKQEQLSRHYTTNINQIININCNI